MQILIPRLFSSHATCLHTKQTEFFLIFFYISTSIVWWLLLNENIFASGNLYNCKQVAYVIFIFFLFLFALTVLLSPVFLLVYPFFILMLLPYFCIYVDHVNMFIVFVFVAFVYIFKWFNTISIFVTICMYLMSSPIFHCVSFKILII